MSKAIEPGPGEHAWYESAVASLFTLEMGYRNGRDRDAEEIRRRGTSILLHQSPLDKLLGDAAAGWDGRYFLVEFKRRQDLLRSEVDKPLRRQLLRDLAAAWGQRRELGLAERSTLATAEIDPKVGDLRRGERLLELTSSTHFLAHGFRGDAGHLEIEVAPYIRLLHPSFGHPRFRTLDEFFGALIGGATADGHPVGAEADDFIGYLAMLLMIARAEGDAGDVGGTEGEMGCLAFASADRWLYLPFRGGASLLWVLNQSTRVRQAVQELESLSQKPGEAGGRLHLP